MPNDERPRSDHSSFVIRHSSFRETAGFTIIELIVVIGIVLVLAGLILATSSYVHNKGARSRAEAEIAAISAALENYKADNGAYPSNGDTGTLDAKSDFNPNPTPAPTKYTKASLYLYEMLSGDADNDPTRSAEKTSYLSFKPNQLGPSDQTQPVIYIRDPFGNSYGYSTINATDSTKGYNPTFDLWSSGGGTTSNETSKWIKNW